MRKLRDNKDSEQRLWYNDWVEKNAKGKVLDIGKSTYWDYGFVTVDINEVLLPTFVADACDLPFKDSEFDTVLCNGMYEFVSSPQKMINECWRVLKPGGTVLFGFVGKGYKQFKPTWNFYDGTVKLPPIKETKSFQDKYHFFVCQKELK